MRHGSHQMTTLILAHKDDNAILEPCASVVRCALVNKLCHTNVSCEWVSCLPILNHQICLALGKTVPVRRLQEALVIFVLELMWQFRSFGK